MILDLQQIKDIILNQPNKDLVNRGVEYTRRMRLHMYGEGLDKHISQIEGFEKEWLHKLRVLYAKSNKDLFSRLGRPIDKVFSARGGSVYYNLSDAQDKRARQLVGDVRHGFSAREWVEQFWRPHMLDDPNGMIFLEILPQQQAMQARREGRSFVYPTYKSITSVYDYLPKGSTLEYVVFNVTSDEKRKAGIKEEDQIYRVVDDAYDYWVKREGKDNVFVLTKHSYPNLFSAVPAMRNSDIVDPQNEYGVLSFFDDAIELAGQYLLKGSIKVTHDMMHGFPKYSEFADDCDNCGGSGYVNAGKCEECKGTGKRPMTKVSDLKLLAWPGKDDQVILPKDVGGYISPDKTYYEIATADLQSLEDYMNVTVWGMQAKIKAQGPTTQPGGDPKTATEVKDEAKPQADRLYPISKMAEKRHKFIIDNIIRLNLSVHYYQGSNGSSVNYGRRYMLEGPDVIWEKYSKARNAGSPISVLDDLLIEYYEAKYDSDPVSLAIALKLTYVEPFVHYKTSEVLGLNPGDEEYKAKLYFSEWLAEQPEATLLSSDAKALRESLYQYASAKKLKEPEKDPIAA